jgi:hypothetical protein
MDPIPYYAPMADASKRKFVPSKDRKHTVKYLQHMGNKPKAYNATIKAASDNVIKTICNAALNVQRNKRIKLAPAHRALFAKHDATVQKLVSKKIALPKKRKLLSQRGGAFWIPALIRAALSVLGSSLFRGNRS